MVQVDQLAHCVCLSLDDNFWTKFPVACLFTLALFRSCSKVMVIGQRMKQQQCTAIACTVHTVNMYTAGGLWQIKLNYDRNVHWLNGCAQGHRGINVVLKWSVLPQVMLASFYVSTTFLSPCNLSLISGLCTFLVFCYSRCCQAGCC